MNAKPFRKPDYPVTDQERIEIKAGIDALGRKRFCVVADVSYVHLSAQLNGHTALRYCILDYYRAVLLSQPERGASE